MIDETLVKSLNLSQVRALVEVHGITGSKMTNTAYVRAKVSPWFDLSDNYNIYVTFLSMKRIPRTRHFQIDDNIPEFNTLAKADPHFYKSGGIQMLLGIGFWATIIESDIIYSSTGLKAQRSTFGYIIFGSIDQSELFDTHYVALRTIIDEENICLIDQLMSRFWELEERSDDELTAEEIYVNENFERTTTRNKEGRYVVRIPFIEKERTLGESRGIALQRFLQLERKLCRQPEIREKYNEFMREFLNLGHMRLATEDELQTEGYFIPHHAVTKRFRTVFDASCATTNGK